MMKNLQLRGHLMNQNTANTENHTQYLSHSYAQRLI